MSVEALPAEELPDLDRDRHNRKARRIGRAIHWFTRLLLATVRIEVDGENNLLPVEQAGGQLALWHGRTMLGIYRFAHRNWWAMISQSKDGEIQKNVVESFGFNTIRGSTGRGGVRAALQASRKIKEGAFFALTPDGPRGPHQKVQQGVLFIAQKSGSPIVPTGIAANRFWAMKSWDSYMIPKPFSRAAIVFLPPISVPAEADEATLAEIAIELENAINEAQAKAERIVRGER